MIFALDVGQKFVGVARSDLEERFAFPLLSFSRAQNQAQNKLLELFKSEKPRLIVVGLPLTSAGDLTDQAQDIKRFCERLAKRCDLQFEFVDESYSTEDVIERLQLKGENQYVDAKQSGRVDAAAAAVILERYLADS